MLVTAYICFMVVSVMNTVTATFVTEAIDVAAQDREIATQVSAQRKRAVFGDLHSLFTHLDETQSGKITKDQFEQYASRSEVIAMFKVLDIIVNDAIAFFN